MMNYSPKCKINRNIFTEQNKPPGILLSKDFKEAFDLLN